MFHSQKRSVINISWKISNFVFAFFQIYAIVDLFRSMRQLKLPPLSRKQFASLASRHEQLKVRAVFFRSEKHSRTRSAGSSTGSSAANPEFSAVSQLRCDAYRMP